MQILTFAILFLALTSISSAQCHPEQGGRMTGEYRYDGNIVLQGAKDIRLADGKTAAGKQKLAALRNEGYACQPVMSMIYQCTKWLRDAELPAEVAKQVARRFSDFKVSFDKQIGKVEKTHSSDAYDEWKTEQKSSFQGRKADVHLYRVFPELHKLSLGDSYHAGDPEFIVHDCEHFELFHVVNPVTEGTAYYVTVGISRSDK